MRTGGKLASLLGEGGYTHVIYEDRDWKDYPGGQSMMAAVDDAYRSGLVQKKMLFDEALYTSRFRRAFRTTRVLVLQRVAASEDHR
jgi:hypothetical protein